MDIQVPEGAEVWVTIEEQDGTIVMHKIHTPVTEVRIINPEVENGH